MSEHLFFLIEKKKTDIINNIKDISLSVTT